GRRIAFIALNFLNQQIWSVSVAGGDLKQPTRIDTNGDAGKAGYPLYSPDGRSLYYVTGPTVWRLPISVESGEPTGDAVKGADMWVADADGKNPVQVTTNSRNLVPSWFPDGDQIAYVSFRDNHWSVWAISLASRRDRLLFDIGRDIQYVRLSPDGRTLVFNL